MLTGSSQVMGKRSSIMGLRWTGRNMTASRRRIFGKGITWESAWCCFMRSLLPGDGTRRSVSAPPLVAPIIFCDRLFQDTVYSMDITEVKLRLSEPSQIIMGSRECGQPGLAPPGDSLSHTVRFDGS